MPWKEPGFLQGEDIGAGDVPDVDVVEGLRPRAVDLWGRPVARFPESS